MIESNCPIDCGECCKVVILTNTGKKKWRKESNSWELKHLKKIRKKDAIKIRPILKKVSWKGLQYYICDLFDYKTNKCKDYGNRPDMCKYFPFYENVVLDAKRMRTIPNCYFINQLMNYGGKR